MLEYLDYIDSENSILGKKEIPTSYYERLESLHATIKKLDEKGKHGQTIESENIRYIYYKTC